jgi:hypothetical protein
MIRGCPWMTVADRCVGHAGGTAGSTAMLRSLAATAPAWPQGEVRSRCDHSVGKHPEDARQHLPSRGVAQGRHGPAGASASVCRGRFRSLRQGR